MRLFSLLLVIILNQIIDSRKINSNSRTTEGIRISQQLNHGMKSFKNQTYQKLLFQKNILFNDNSSQRISMSDNVIIAQPYPLNLTLSFIATPFKKLLFQESKNIFLMNIQIQKDTNLIINCIYNKQSKFIIKAIYHSKSKSDIKTLEQQVQLYKWNKMNFNINFDSLSIGPKLIQTKVQFFESVKGWKGIISNLSISVNQNNNKVFLLQNKKPKQWVNNVDPISQPVSLKGLVLPSNLLSQKTPHQIPLMKQGHKLLMCHDMKNGYKQQIDQYSNTFSLHAYRYNHWKITDIFVYFSHQNIAIPPKHYRILCKRQKVLCLATFIIESDIDWLKYQMADYLIFLAREYQFDGYLINIQYRVKDPKLFKEWLIYLTNNIHDQLPNSKIMLYDAIVEDGNIFYQSGISQHNIDYLRTVDYFFTDYHWNQHVINQTSHLTTQLNRSFDIFVGNDVYGRGTFGGGQLNTDIGVRQINKYNLSAAIFAPGYIYQAQGGKINYPRFEQYDDNLWFGKAFKDKEIGEKDWAFQFISDWEIVKKQSVCRKNNCKKSFQYTLPILKQFDFMIFTVFVTHSTKPNQYIIKLDLIDNKGHILKSITQIDQSQNFQSFKQERMKLYFTQSLKQKAKHIRVEYSQVKQGISFRKDTFYVMFYKTQKSISSYYQQRPDILPYQSYYNIAIGPNYFFNGIKSNIGKGYNFLADYDLPYQNKRLFKQNSFNQSCNSESVNAYYDHKIGWIGAGSLKIHADNRFCLRLLKLNQSVNYIELKLKYQSNKLQIPYIGYKFKNNSNYVDSNIKITRLPSFWSQLVSKVEFNQYLQLSSIYLIFNHTSINQTIFNLGEIVVYSSPQIVINKYKPQIKIVRNQNNPQYISVYINLKQFPLNSKTVFVKINNKVIGNIYQTYSYFNKIKQINNSIFIQLLSESMDGGIQPIYDKQINLKP